MSYVLFSQTSTANGTRNTWNSGAQVGATGATTGAVVNGALVTGVANSSFNEMAIAGVGGWNAGDTYADGALVLNNSRALYDLSDASGLAGFQIGAAFAAATSGIGNVLGASGSNVIAGANDRTLKDGSGYDAGTKTLDLALNDINWNDIKNVEIRIDSADTGTGFQTVAVSSFVDARIKVGDTTGCRDAADFLSGRFELPENVFNVKILDGKRGQIEAAESDVALAATIDVWTNNSGWQNSFSNTGSVFGDRFEINYGALAIQAGVSEFGNGAGLQIGTGASQISVYNGQLTTLLTNMGAGNDLYDATNGAGRTGSATSGSLNEAIELQTIDYVWGGSGNDVIKAGGNNDVLFGDFGSYGSVGQSADPAAIQLEFGGSGNVEDWVNDTGVTLYGKPLNAGGTAASGSTFVVAQGNLADRAKFEVPVADSAQTAATWNTQSAGIGISLSDTGTSPNGTGANPEINAGTNDNSVTDVLGVNLGRDATAASFDLSLFYAGDGSAAIGSRIEQALVTIGSDTNNNGVLDAGEVTGSFILRADGSTAALSGAVSAASGSTAVPGGSAYSNTNPGLVAGSFTASSTFDVIEFASAGLVNGSYQPINNSDVSDFYLREVCFTLATSAGNDVLEAGGGIDFLNGGGDTGRYDLCSQGTGNLLLNGGFETIAADAAQQESSTWYLTEGGAAAGAGFGWTLADPATQNIEIQQDGTGGLSPFAGNYKLELDSHPTAQARPLVSQAVATCEGGLYVLEFALAERQGDGNASSDFQLFWDGAVIATFTNPAGSDSWTASGLASGVSVTLTDVAGGGAWFTAKVTGLVGDGASSVGFQAVAGQTNTFGTFIDAVALTEVAPVASLTVTGDTLSGGAQADTFAYALGDGVDLILDYNKLEGDVIDLDNAANYSVSGVIYGGVLSTLIESNGDDGAIIVKGVAMADVVII